MAQNKQTPRPKIGSVDFQAQECAHPKSNFFFEQTQFAVTACGT
jgi:hypothetical protein